jgi:acetyltransferase
MLLEVPPKMTGDMAFDQEKARRLIAGAPDQGFMSESDSKEILTAYGLPMIRTQIAATEAQAARIAREMGYPVVMKLHSPDITHKTDAGGVRLDLRGDADVGEAYRQIVSSARAIQTRCPDRGRDPSALFFKPGL